MDLVANEDYLRELDPEQLAAVTCPSRRVRGLAGAGTGKTRVLEKRVRWLVQAAGVNPARIAVITFTKKAANELRHRLGDLGDLLGLCATIHSLGLRILLQACGGEPCDEAIAKRLVRRAMGDLKSREKFGEVYKAITRAKTLDQPIDPRFAREFSAYQQLLRDGRLWDYADMIGVPARMLATTASLRAKWSAAYDAILIDECQDTSQLQWSMLYWLVRPDTWLFLTGDIMQCIYAWRGAEPEMMLGDADASFGPFTDFTISRNYRSFLPIISAANRVVRDSVAAVALTPTRGDHPFAIQVLREANEAEEAAAAVGAIEAALASGYRPGDCAVLTRTNAALEAYETECLARKLPYIVATGISFYGRAEIMDVLAYLSLAQTGWLQSTLDLEAITRIFNRPSRYLGKAWLDELQALGGWQVFGQGGATMRFSRAYMGDRARQLWHEVQTLHDMVNAGATPAQLVEAVRKDIGYEEWLVGDSVSETDDLKRENLQQLTTVAARYQTLPELLGFAEKARLRSRQETREQIDRIVLSTVHRAKGLEWPVVVVGGLMDGLLPHAYGDPAEERRIWYVAITRAKNLLILATRTGRSQQLISRFLQETISHFGVPLDWEEDDGVASPASPAAAGGKGGVARVRGDSAPALVALRGGRSAGGSAGDRRAGDRERDAGKPHERALRGVPRDIPSDGGGDLP